MINLITLNFCSTPIRIYIPRSNKVFFCTKDIYSVFGYTNARKGIKDALNSDCEVIKLLVEDSSGKKQQINFVDELGVETFILKSKLDIAAELKKWLDSTVKSNIEEFKKEKKKKNTDVILEFLHPSKYPTLEDEFKINTRCSFNTSNLNEIYSIIASRFNQLKSQGTTMYTPTELGKFIGTSGRYVNILLTKLKYQTKVGNRHKLTLLGQSKGGNYSVTSIRKGSNTPVGIIKWPESVVEDLKKCMFEAE